MLFQFQQCLGIQGIVLFYACFFPGAADLVLFCGQCFHELQGAILVVALAFLAAIEEQQGQNSINEDVVNGETALAAYL